MSISSSKKRVGFVLCIDAGEYDGELVVGKVYRTAAPDERDRAVDLRVIDESGEDYLYPAKWFVPVEIPAKAKRALAAVAAT
jgi:hypothetical protein